METMKVLHKAVHRRCRDIIALISVLNVTFIKLLGSALGCHCPDGDGIWWKGSGGCTQSEQQPAKRSCEYKVLPAPCCSKGLSHWCFSSLNCIVFWSAVNSTPTGDSGAQILWLFQVGYETGMNTKGLSSSEELGLCEVEAGISKICWETPSPQSGKEIVLSWERKRYSQE